MDDSLSRADAQQRADDIRAFRREQARLAADGLYATQERLMTRIVQACAAYPVIEALEIGLRKFPVRAGSGSLGVHLAVDGVQLQRMRGDQG